MASPGTGFPGEYDPGRGDQATAERFTLYVAATCALTIVGVLTWAWLT